MSRKISNEEKLILYICSNKKILNINQFKFSSINWKYFLNLITQNRVGPFIYSQLYMNSNLHIPYNIMSILKKQYLITWADTNLKTSEFTKLANILFKSDIKFIPLKGILFANTIYRENAQRPMQDIDILVYKDDIKKIDSIMTNFGYIQKAPLINMGRTESHKNFYEKIYIKKNDGISLMFEFHIALYHTKFFPINYNELITNSQYIESVFPNSLLNVNLNVMSIEENICSLCVHNAKHFYETNLLSLLDISLLANYKNVNWKKVIYTAKSWEINLPLYISLILAKNLLQSNIPSSILKQIEPNSIIKSYLSYIIDFNGIKFSYLKNSSNTIKRIFLGLLLLNNMRKRVSVSIDYIKQRYLDYYINITKEDTKL